MGLALDRAIEVYLSVTRARGKKVATLRMEVATLGKFARWAGQRDVA